MNVSDAYALLGINPPIDEGGLKRAWREQVRLWHPDHHPGDPGASARIQHINGAYEILQKHLREPAPAWAPTIPDPYQAPAYANPYTNIYGSPRSHQPSATDPYQKPAAGGYPTRGEDMEASVTIDVTEALCGIDIVVDIERWDVCRYCGGLDRDRVRLCQHCQGFGREMLSESLNFTLPAGVRDDDQVRMNGVGNSGLWGGAQGDVVVHVHVEGDSLWEEHDGRLTLDNIPLSLEEVVVGATLRIPTPKGWKTLRLTGPIDCGQMYRIRSAGFPEPDGSLGDLWCSFRLVTPDWDLATIQQFQKFIAQLPENNPRETVFDKWSSVMDEITGH